MYARKNHTVAIAANTTDDIYLDIDCFMHAVHLCVLAGLKIVDVLMKHFGWGFKYYSSAATLANTLRQLSNEILTSWISVYKEDIDKVEAVGLVKKVFPKCCAARWGSVHEFEDRALPCEHRQATKN